MTDNASNEWATWEKQENSWERRAGVTLNLEENGLTFWYRLCNKSKPCSKPRSTGLSSYHTVSTVSNPDRLKWDITCVYQVQTSKYQPIYISLAEIKNHASHGWLFTTIRITNTGFLRFKEESRIGYDGIS